jgi:EmrB/QacA subfamily drug resistance transporter
MLGIGLGVLMSTLDTSVVNVALPTLVQELHTTLATVQWVVLSYLLVIAALMLSVARLGDMLGKKRLYNLGLVLFTIGSLLSGLSPSVGWLIGFRALQGTGAVMMTALGTAIITEVFPAEERGRALGINGAIVSVGIAAGPVLGGLLIGTVGWRSIFLINVPIGVLAAIIVYRVIPPLARDETTSRFDGIGAIILLVTLGAYALGMTLGQELGFRDGWVIGLLVGSAVSLAIFLIVESRVSDPMIELSLFKNVLFGVNLLMGFLVFIMIGGTFIVPFYLELVKGFPPAQVGLLMVVFPAMMGIAAPLSGSLSDRFGSRLISLIGLAIIAASCFLFGSLRADTSIWGFTVRFGLLGAGVGVFNSPNNSAIMGSVPRRRLGIASGLLALTRVLGQTSGLPLVGAVFSGLVMTVGVLSPGADVTAAAPEALAAGVSGSFQIAGAIVAVSTVLAAFALWFDRHNGESNPASQTAAGPAGPAVEAPPGQPAPPSVLDR